MKRKTLDDVFDVETRDVTIPTLREIDVNQVSEKEDKSVDSDADLASKNIKTLITIGQAAAMRASEVAEDSESPRAYEVLSTLLKTMSDMNIQMLDIHEKKKKIKGQSEQPTGSTVNNTAVFVGTTAGLMEMIEQHRKGNS